MIKFGNDIVTVGGDWLKFGYLPRIYHVTVLAGQHGTATVNHTEGPTGTLVTISTSPDTGYELDTISLTGATLINGNQFYIEHSDVTVNVSFAAINYNPLNLPPYTMRFKFTNGFTPVSYVSGAVWTQVSSSPNVWDVTYSNSNWEYLLTGDEDDLLEVLGANTSGVISMKGLFMQCPILTNVAIFDTSSVTNMDSMYSLCAALISIPRFDTSNVTNMHGMLAYSAITSVPLLDTANVTNMSNLFHGCSSLRTVPLLDTSSVTNMANMFWNCTALNSLPQFNTALVTDFSRFCTGCSSITEIPLLDTSHATNVSEIFSGCRNVEHGALSLYRQLSTQSVPPSNHTYAFANCGADTVTGAAELAQIPSDWK